ncbi:LysR family transcriptional regulator [Pigmentiphaga litoralis]|uniref:DNA-binding transcriptional LysR family regulator n=1 Tax=Pigmentiphaga litoralis TaxID=516702 RepID=A0A7Y9ITU1_9BURK|nr:LysR family transcriptional regulator [Pigmentiphaga litoralis]NYE23562.1 DNA-binding transcriptional LysR family regulator [Pigmentiphaga litoralis]NYE82824.1 DNA-binding transcriptional LysR family regulator [Pigmentiphaga litoralis]
MDAHALALLVDIIEAGNLSLAARRLKISRANVSYHLAQLEKQTGVQLIRRTTRRIEPTEMGLKLYQHGRVIRDELRAAQESVATLGKGLHGSVRMSMPTGFGYMVMSGWLIEFKRSYPNITLDLVFDNKIDDLLRDEVDIAVRVMSDPPQQMVAIELAQMRHVVCASVAYAAEHGLPDTLEALQAAPVITSAVTGRSLKVSAYLGTERRELTLSPSLASENFVFLREAVLAGLGLGLLPDYTIAQDILDGRVVNVLDPWRFSVFGTRMFLLRMPDRYQTQAARTLIDFVVAKAAEWRALPTSGQPPA